MCAAALASVVEFEGAGNALGCAGRLGIHRKEIPLRAVLGVCALRGHGGGRG